MSSPPPGSTRARPRPSRIAVLLLITAIIVSVWGVGLMPHVIYRVPLALVTVWGLWGCRRWAYPLVFINAAVWVLVFLSVVMFLLVAPPWELWSAWLYWLVPTGLVVAVCVLMMSTAGRRERTTWPHRKMNLAFKAPVATFIFYGLVGCIGLFNTARSYSALPDLMAASPLPPSFYIGVGQQAAQLLASVVGLGFLLFAGRSRARIVCLVAIGVLLVVHLLGWPAAHRAAVASGSLLLVHGVRTAIALWFAFVFACLAPNSSSEPTPLRGAT